MSWPGEEVPETYDPDVCQRVLAMRRAGVPLDVIADQLTVTPEAAAAMFTLAIGKFKPEFIAALEADRLDRLHMAVWPAANQGDLKAVDTLLRISERREQVVRQPMVNDHAYRSAFDRSAEAATTAGVDEALVESGRKIADRIDEAIATGSGQEVTKAMYLVPHMMNVLRELLATPATRHAAGLVEKQPETGTLHKLRSVHGRPDRT